MLLFLRFCLFAEREYVCVKTIPHELGKGLLLNKSGDTFDR